MTFTIIQWITLVINNVMTTSYRTLSTVTSNVMMASVTTMQIFIEINKFKGDKITFKRSYDKQNPTLVIISY